MDNSGKVNQPTRCLFCADECDRELYPERLSQASFTGYAFSARRRRRREHYRLVVCKKCSLVRSNPIIAEAEINRLYAESGFIFSAEAPYAARTYQALLKKLMQRHGLSIGNLFEVGCSTGFFLEKALNLGIAEVRGFEPSLDCYQAASHDIRRHIVNEVFSLDKLDGKKFDLACSFQVIDHLRDPKQTVTSMVAALKPGGHLLLVCHDVESWTAKILGENSPIFDVEHIYLFSRKTMALLFAGAGLEIVAIGTMANTYPLGYWMRMLPLANKLSQVMPGFIGNIPVRLNAGNLFALGRKIADQ